MLLERLRKQSGLTTAQIEMYAATASKRYKIYTIKKKNGGDRTIEHPSRALKSLQRWVNKSIISKLPTHVSATAYAKGCSIRKNAQHHLGSIFTLHVDFKSFFPSFKSDGISDFFRIKSKELGIELSEEDVNFITRIVCRNNCLTIGAPTSPSITNAIMFEFDDVVNEWCNQRRLVYTRYADDLYISAFEPGMLSDVIPFLISALDKQRFVRLKINHDKTAFLSKKYRRAITGIIITTEGKLSIGLKRKKLIKSMVLDFKYGRLPMEDKSRLHGLISFALDIEPAFHETLIRKYGENTIKSIST
ncbi:MAG: RNA-directed DNA [Rhodospirillaceae bacterium]|nr:MAG: RNA-directed DNA [Rhodospirillaceae bacterium]TNC96348.1 MAG: RNA-directed DNA polymerase [Stygiobacter sp.]